MKDYRITWGGKHPKASPSNGNIYEHVLVAEKALGKYLPDGAEVHHVDGNGRNNTPSNLVICQDRAYHKLLHVRQRVRDAGGDPNAERICGKCGQVKAFGDFNRMKSNKSTGLQSRCRVCTRKVAA